MALPAVRKAILQSREIIDKIYAHNSQLDRQGSLSEANH